MEPISTRPCSSCGAPITAGELAEGLAVRIDGRLICPLCVDTLPGTSQVKINQLRAIRGLDVTTYRVTRTRHPQLQAYSFTTTAQLTQHRRALQSGGRFDAPSLPADHKPVPKLPPATRKAAPLHGPGVWIGGGVAAVVIMGLAIGLSFRGGSTPPAATLTTETPAAHPVPQRLDYAPSAREAWNEASVDPACPGDVLARIAKELEAEIAVALTALDGQLAAGEANMAAQALTTVEIPDDIRFRPLRERVEQLAQRIARARSATSGVAGPPTPAVVTPAPLAETPDIPPVKPVLIAAQPMTDPKIEPSEPGAEPGEPAGEPDKPAAIADVAPPKTPSIALFLTDFTHKLVPWDPLELPQSRGRDDARDARYTTPDLGEPYLLSELMRRTSNHHIAIRFAEPLPPGSGVAMLVHPRRPDREELVAIFSDHQGRSARVSCPLIPMTWNSLVIAVPEHAVPWVSLRVEDVRSATTEFIIGKTVVTPGRPATVEDLGVRQRALLTPTYSELAELVTGLSVIRKQRDPRWLAPSKVKILITDRMTAGNWTTTVRARLKEVFTVPWKGAEAPRGMIEKLVLHDQWLNDLFKENDPAKASVHPSNHHLLVVISAGSEMQAGLTVEQGVFNFWLPLIEASLAKGILPVAVLGPSRVDVNKREDAERMWVLLDEELAKRNISLPKIDLRPARSLSVERMETGHAKLASDLLCEALGELHERLQRLKPKR